MNQQEAREQYADALKAGLKTYKERTAHGLYPYLPVLDEILPPDSKVDSQREMGLMEVPADLFVGTKTVGRRTAFAYGFLPLLDAESEFSYKWIALCRDHLGDTGIHDPVRCYEYLGKFYVLEGNKRVSVLKWNGATTIPAIVTRLIPMPSNDPEISLYYEFMDFYQVTKLYTIRCSVPGNYARILSVLGGTPQKPWDDRQRQSVSTAMVYFQDAFQKLKGEHLSLRLGDALVVWLRVHTLQDIKELPFSELCQQLEALWPDVVAFSHPDPIQVQSEPSQPVKPTFLERILPSPRPVHLKIGFINEYFPTTSNWCMAHERGRLYLEKVFRNHVSTHSYTCSSPEQDPEELIEEAISDGCELIFTTTPPLVNASLRASVRHPEVMILNCSVDVPYTSIRTYYCRVYEAKFITGALAGAMASDGNIGYVGSYPIYGVPASINAFALGAQLANPNAKVHLEWSCTPGNPMDYFYSQGFEVISNLDVPGPEKLPYEYGTYKVLSDGSLQALASPYWRWELFYENVVRSILDGRWAKEQPDGTKAVNYWWGLKSGAVDLVLDPNLPEGLRQLTKILKDGIVFGLVDPFRRTIYAQDGSCKNNGTASLSTEEILHMDWLCSNVVGTIPTLDEVLPRSQNVVKYQGVFRDAQPPAKE